MKIQLSEELKTKVNTGTIKAKELVSFILETVSGASTNKEISNTALKDISINGKYPKAAKIDSWKGIIHLTF